MLAKESCVVRIRKDEVVNILLSFNGKNKSDDSINGEEEKISEGENDGDKYDWLEVNKKKSGNEWGECNVCVNVWKMPAA